MLNKLKYLFVGSPLSSKLADSKRLNKIRALAAFSPDALSSIAYANQEIYIGLALAGTAGLALQFPIALAITLLLGVVALSYSQTIRGYPNGGGSYIVARSNLGILPGLIAGGALLLDYILTAAVSLTAGVAAIASAFPVLWQYRTWIALALLVVITLLNLRGLKESGTAISIPVYLFLASFLLMIGVGFVHALIQGHPSPPIPGSITPIRPLGIFLVLHAFSAGCTALTGIEAISNGTPSFQPPEWLNARKTLTIMAVIMGVLFLGSMGLTQFFGVTAGANETILSALARRLLGTNILYYIVQFSTLAVLSVAANTSFAGFPRVTAILARDKYMPRQLSNLGDRLVFHNGIILLSVLAAILIIAFNGDSHLLIPLFAVGAFTAFTFSQAGMMMHWIKLKDRHWFLKAAINGFGSLVTAITLLIIGINKFLGGAWISILVIGLFIFFFQQVHTHYKGISEQLSMNGLPPSLRPSPAPRVVLPVSGVHRGMVDAVNFSRSISNHVTAVFIDIDPGEDEEVLRQRWNDWFPDVEFVVVPSPYRSLIEPLLDYLEKTDAEHNDGQQAVVVLPELVLGSAWQEVLHNQSAREIKKALLYQRRSGLQRIIIDVPFHLKE